jgi:hypothetical protein
VRSWGRDAGGQADDDWPDDPPARVRSLVRLERVRPGQQRGRGAPQGSLARREPRSGANHRMTCEVCAGRGFESRRPRQERYLEPLTPGVRGAAWTGGCCGTLRGRAPTLVVEAGEPTRLGELVRARPKAAIGTTSAPRRTEKGPRTRIERVARSAPHPFVARGPASRARRSHSAARTAASRRILLGC